MTFLWEDSYFFNLLLLYNELCCNPLFVNLYCIFNFASFAKYEIATFCLFSKSGNEVRAEVDNPIVENGCSSQSCFS